MSGRTVYLSLKVRGKFIKLGLFQCSIDPICHLASQALKITWLLILSEKKSWLFLDLERLTIETPLHRLSLPLLPSTSDKGSWGRQTMNKEGVTQKASRADVTSRLGFWPRGHSITPTVWQKTGQRTGDPKRDTRIKSEFLMANLTTPKPMMEWSNEVGETVYSNVHIFFVQIKIQRCGNTYSN